MSATASVVTVEVADAVATVTINRPDRRNAMDWEVFTGLRMAGEQVATDDRVRAVLVTGAQGTFSSGLDTSLFGAIAGKFDDAAIVELQTAFNVFEDCPKPTVAMIRGHCLGAGAQLAAACHLRLVADDAAIAIAERRWALVPDLGGTWRLPRLIGLGRATDWILTARTIDAHEAVASGFAQAQVEDGGAALLADLATAPGATQRVTALVRDNFDRSRAHALAAERRAQAACLEGPDVAEAVTAAQQGRPPEFIGR